MKVETLILGAGPAGLSAAYSLLKSGRKVVVIERNAMPGGLMRSVKKDDFNLDFGYKHLYSRIPEVHEFWLSLLGKDFIQYKPRIGVLFGNSLLEKEKEFKGLRRGMPYTLLFSAFLDLIRHRIRYRNKPLSSLQDFAYSRRGGKFTRIFSQGFDERLKGRQWSQLPVPENPDSKGDKQQANFMTRFYQDAVRDHDNRALWFHPAKGSGQIVERLESEIRSMGGEIYYESEVTHIGTSGDTITTVTVRYGRETITYEPGMVISSLPLEAMAKVMNIAFTPAARELSFKRSVVMIYLFLDKEVAFPHNCIQISSPELNMARITNYSAFGGSMVPDGKGCICIEFFCLEQSGFFAMNDEELYKVALAECEKAQLISRSDCFDYLVFKSPGADPATSWEDYVNDESRAQLYKVLEGYANLFQISRTGIDKSTYAGLLAAKAIVSEDKREFTALTRPDIFTSWQANVS